LKRLIIMPGAGRPAFCHGMERVGPGKQGKGEESVSEGGASKENLKELGEESRGIGRSKNFLFYRGGEGIQGQMGKEQKLKGNQKEELAYQGVGQGKDGEEKKKPGELHRWLLSRTQSFEEARRCERVGAGVRYRIK